MTYCKRTGRSCSCGKLFTYDREGKVSEMDAGAGCLSDEEVRIVLTVFLREWRRRRSDAELESMQALGQLH